MEETINLYISNMTKSINLVIKCNRLATILDLKKLVAKEINTYSCLFRLTNGKNLEKYHNLNVLLSDLDINDGDKLYIVNKLNVDIAVLKEWARLDSHNWLHRDEWFYSDFPFYGVTTNEERKVIEIEVYNKVTLIPPEVSQLKSLKRLILDKNELTSVPSFRIKSFFSKFSIAFVQKY